MPPLTPQTQALTTARRLTTTQRAALERSRRATYDDNSGDGALILDGNDAGVFKRLASKGLVWISLPTGRSYFGCAKITPAGRAALATLEQQP